MTFSADGKTAQVPVFIQPSSEQDCLLGSNVLNILGVTVCDATGEPLGAVSNPTVKASVHLVHAVRVPGRTAIFAEAEINEPLKEGGALVFERNRNSLAESGLTSHNLLVTVKSGNKVLIPFHNRQNFSLTAYENVVGTI